MPFPPPRRRTTLLLAALAGLVVDAGFPGLAWWPLTFLGMGLLFVALGRDSAWWNALVGQVFGLAFFLPHLTWAEYAVGPVPWLALGIAQAGFVAVFGAAWTWARRGAATWERARLQVPVFAILWVGVEEARSVLPFGGFPWGRLAFSQADSPMVAWAWVGGVPVVSALVAAVGALVGLGLVAARYVDVGRASGTVVLASVLVVSGLVIPLDTRAQDGDLRVGAVQGNVPDEGLDSFQQAREVLDNHVAGTHALLEQVGPGDLDVVLWPENGSDIDPRADDGAALLIGGAARALDAPVLVGTDNFPEEGGRLNTSLLWDPELGPVHSYAKRRPAPFAEYIPMRDVARRFSDAVDRVRTDMVPGQEVGVVPVDVPRLGREVPLAVGICFEVAYDVLIREAVQQGGQVLVIPTNNATFGRTDESTQQLAMSRLRAVEHGRATVQISTVGVSAVITPAGLVREETELFTAAQMVDTLALRSSLTPATRFGSAISWTVRALAVVVFLAGAVGAARVRRDDRRAPDQTRYGR
ncbi:apolipoprotein N-acyltransferase [Cellulomonas bogoriensis]|uniref:Apolipoprotein N-acyltransferase n=1 Tax=Cellulomonas bogoriensis 69B4 = DSM 16987 TaxID=1386082 RepID=A0A0A0BMV1_9CELL|nr:apolipoprotein N-acyltransferase [Cellulomonas bogoriensis]KGM09266.1 acyltransferase [Cellulomonas bogoriensis 69B4 = DSM 16987]